MPVEDGQSLRIDKWLWYARFCKSRALATRLVALGRLRRNGTVVRKPHQSLRAGDVLTFALGPHIRVIRVLALATRRGPAPEARALYEDLDPPTAQPKMPRTPRAPSRPQGMGRPTKADRRAFERLTGGED